MPAIKGTASVADSRARRKALKKTKFPRNFSASVSLEKVNKPVLIQWIEEKITSILGFEDEIVSSTAINLFLPSDNSYPDPRKAQLDLAGFLGDQADTFSAEMWKLMLEAQAGNSGIPQSLLEIKKKEMTERMTRKIEGQQEKVQAVNSSNFSQMNHSGARGKNECDVNHSPSKLHIPIRRTDGIFPGHGSSKKHDDKGKVDTAVKQFQKYQPTARQGFSEDVSEQELDQFGRVHLLQRSRNLQKYVPCDQHDRNRSYASETSRRNQFRARSRDRSDHGGGRNSYYRRRSNNRDRTMDDGTRRLDDRKYNSNHHDNRSGYHHHNHQCDDNQSYDRKDWCNRRQNFTRERCNLERRMIELKKQLSERDGKNGDRNIQRIEYEMKVVQDRVYELERDRRRYASRDEYFHSLSHRGRSPSYNRRRGSRRKRSNSTTSDISDSMRSGRDDYSTDSADSERGDQKRPRLSQERMKKNKGSCIPRRQRRRRSRSFSSTESSEQSL